MVAKEEEATSSKDDDTDFHIESPELSPDLHVVPSLELLTIGELIPGLSISP